MKYFALAGNPNCGKTTLWNSLTGMTARVGNWPGVTVDKREGLYRKLPEKVGIIDLPGIYSLSPYTPEEIIARNYILDEAPDCVINVVDSTNLERNLYLTSQLLEMDVPVVIALNFGDVLEKNGDSIDADELSRRIGVPVVTVSALKNVGLKKLMEVAYEAAERERFGKTFLTDIPFISDILAEYKKRRVASPLFHTIKMVESDGIEIKAQSEIAQSFTAAMEKSGINADDLMSDVADKRYNYITENFSPLIFRRSDNPAENGAKVKNNSHKIDRVLTHKFFGIPIFLIILFTIFHLTFAEDFLYLGALGALGEDFVSLPGTFFEGLFGEGGIASPGVILFNFFDILMGGLGGAVTDGLTGAGAFEWAVGLIGDGILGGLFAVLSFLPQILLLFLFFSILEDTGYMARVAFMLDRIFRRFGVTGRAFMPMIMGFGCSVPAIINTRTLANQKERTATVRVIPFFSCGAKLPVLTAIAAAIVSQVAGLDAGLITFSMYLLGIVVAMASLIVMNISNKGEASPFIMELPEYRVPKASVTALLLWDKLKHFVKKAFTVIFLSTIIVWLLSHLSPTFQYLPNEEMPNSILAHIGMSVQFLLTPLGFGSQLVNVGYGEWGWVFCVAAIVGLIAKEEIIAIIGIMAACIMPSVTGDVEGTFALVEATGIGIPALLAFIAFNMTTIPCFAALRTAQNELPKGQFRYTLAFWLFTSYFVSSAIYLVGEFIWPLAIYLAIIAIFTLYAILQRKDKLPKFIKKLLSRKSKRTVSFGCSDCSSCSSNCGNNRSGKNKKGCH